MYVYLGIFAYVAIGAIIHSFRDVRGRPAKLWITALLLVLLIGFRWEVGADWNTYRMAVQYSSARVGMEPGYALVNSVAAALGWDVWFPDLICAIIFVYGLTVFCRRQPNPWLALVVAVPYLVIAVGMGFTRQSAAVGLAMVAITQFVSGARARVFLSIGIATLFHTSAIVLAPLFALAMARRNIVISAVLVVFAIILYVVFSDRIASRMSDYELVRYVAGGAVPRILMNIIAAIIFIVFRYRFTDIGDELRFWTFLSCISFLMIPLLFFVSSSTIVDRLGIYIVPLQIFVMSRVPIVFSHRLKQNIALLFAVIFYSLSVELVWLNFGTEAQAWIPYRNVLWEALSA